jgi:hypothetical protein
MKKSSLPPAPFEREEWMLVPFETKEGMTEVWLKEECWGSNVHVLMHATPERLSAWMLRVMQVTTDSADFPGLQGQASRICDKATGRMRAAVIAFPAGWEDSVENFLTLVHEAHHVTSYILHAKGVVHCDATEECWAYLQESLVSRLANAMRMPVMPFAFKGTYREWRARPVKKPRPQKGKRGCRT